MKTIKALEPITAYGHDKLMLFVGETAEVEDSFADALIAEGKAEAYEGSSGSTGGVNVISCTLTEDFTVSPSRITLTNATALADMVDYLSEHPEKSASYYFMLEVGNPLSDYRKDAGAILASHSTHTYNEEDTEITNVTNNVIAMGIDYYVIMDSNENYNIRQDEPLTHSPRIYYVCGHGYSFTRDDIDENDVATCEIVGD